MEGCDFAILMMQCNFHGTDMAWLSPAVTTPSPSLASRPAFSPFNGMHQNCPANVEW